MSASPHHLILASAGTGKTYRLTGRFLEILFEDVPPERILATTFTRKAAGEILDRVLRRLADAAESDEAAEALSVALGRSGERALGAAAVRRKLVDLTRSLERFRVRTLDAFFVQLARLFALDLGLPPDWGIVEEAADDALRRAALGATLERARPDEVIGVLRGLQQADTTRSIERVLLGKVAEGRAAFLDSRREAWETQVVPDGLPAAEVAALPERIARLDLPRNKGKGVNANWQKAVRALGTLVEAGAWKDVLDNGLVGKVLDGEETYWGKPIAPEWAQLVRALWTEAKHVLLGEVDAQNRAAWSWLERFERSYEALKREERAYRFEDLPKALHPREENRLHDQDLVWYRLDGRIDHVLLDEFQDTSPVQWRLLGNLTEEILADGTGRRSFFCVGDVKQSIYGWRDAEPRLLGEMQDRFPILQPERMSTSWRSSSVVLDTVTRVFGAVDENAVFDSNAARRAAAQAFREDFDLPLAARELPGAAWLLMAPEDPERAEAPVLELAAHRARAILDEAPRATVGILLRRNVWVARLIHLLRREGVRASNEGGNPLVDSAAVLHLVSLMHLVDHPGDQAAAFHVAHSPLGPEVGLTPAGFPAERGRVALALRRRLTSEGYGAFCAGLGPVVAEGYGAWDRKRYAQLVDLAHAFDDQADLRADRFVDHVRRTQVEDPSATQVKVMTVHASKGLEFDAVLLPELDTRFGLQRPTIVTQRGDPAGLFERVSHTRASRIARLDPRGLGELCEEHDRREARESLCLLYVAMTRARHRLDLLVQHAKPDSAPQSFAGLLRSALAPNRTPDANHVLWSHPDCTSPWFPAELGAAPEQARIASGGPAPPPHGRLLFREASAPLLARRSPSAQEGDGKLRAAELLRSQASTPRLRGTLVHRWMQEVGWIEDFAATDDELLAIGRRLRADEGLLREALAEFRRALERPHTRALLARRSPGADGPGPGSAGQLELWRERPFGVLLPAEPGADAGGEELWSGAFDRVLLERRGEAFVAAELVDFKTDRVEPDDVAERLEFYRPQLASYRRVLSRMTGLAPEQIEARVAFLHADEVRAV